MSHQITNSKDLNGVVQVRQWLCTHYQDSLSWLLDRVDSSKTFLAVLAVSLNKPILSTNYISVYHSTGCRHWWLQQGLFPFWSRVPGQMVNILCGAMVLAQGHANSRWQSFSERSADVSVSITSFGGCTCAHQPFGDRLPLLYTSSYQHLPKSASSWWCCCSWAWPEPN